MRNFYSFNRSELEKYFLSLGASKAKAKHLFRAIYSLKSIDGAFGISESLKGRVKKDFSFSLPEIVDICEDNTACKFLIKLCDGELIETVCMKEPYGDAVCVSSQAGCAMKCSFCETGKQGLRRNLTAGEMVAQVYIAAMHSENGIVGVSVMGMGEPFLNYDEVIKLCNIITDSYGLAIAPRRVTISTCGIVPSIIKYATDESRCNLAISLHAPNNVLRSRLMPINKTYPLEKLLPALHTFTSIKNKRITIEYIMISGVNDTLTCAKELADLLVGLDCYVNIIPFNASGNSFFAPSTHESIMMFYDVLKKSDITVTMRRKLGGNLDAACGQLRGKHAN